MNKKWSVAEKVIGILITIWGIFTLYSVVSNVYGTISSGFLNSGHTTYLHLLQTNHLNVVLSLASIFGGTFLLFNDKTGWLLSLICSSMYAVLLFISATTNHVNNKQTGIFFYQSYSVTAILFAIILILLFQKPFRGKYKPTEKNWRNAAFILIILIADKIFL